jgi:AraC-like DNA-binding protein
VVLPTRSRISLTAAIGLIDAIAAAGGDPDAVLRAAGVDRSALANPQGFIPSATFVRVLEAAATMTGDERFGLHFGERYHPKDLGALTYVVLHSPTFAVGIQNIARYHRLFNQASRVWIDHEGQWTFIRHRLVEPSLGAGRQQTEYGLAIGLNMIRMMAGREWAPAEVQFAHDAPGDLSEHTRVFGAPVSFGRATNAFVVEPVFLERTVPAADERLYAILQPYLDSVMAELPSDDGLLGTVRRAVGESLRDGAPTLGHVAQKIGATPRTLQRRLREHQVDFKRLVEERRRQLAVTYLRDPRHTLSEIAYLLGYSEVSAFNRAFKRWTGATPSSYRRGAAA